MTNTKTKQYVSPTYTNIFKSKNERVLVDSYSITLQDSKTKQDKSVDMIRLTKVQNQFVDGYGYQDIKKYLQFSEDVFVEMISSLHIALLEDSPENKV